jgi:hypothetical protein
MVAATPTLDAATQAYVGDLRTYFVPLVTTNSSARMCLRDVGNAAQDARAGMMATCRPLFAAELGAAQSFSTQIAAAAAPAALRSEDATLKLAAPQLVTLLTAQLGDIDAHDVARFIASEDAATPILYSFLAPIQQINLAIHAGPPPLTSPLPTLYYQST